MPEAVIKDVSVDDKLSDDKHSMNKSNDPSNLAENATNTVEYAEPCRINERKLLRKIDLRIIPWLSLLYLLNFLDRATIGNAKVSTLDLYSVVIHLY